MVMNIKTISDEKLVEIVRSKNRDFFCEIITRYQNKIFSYINRLINNRDDAEDLTQDVFIKVYKNLFGFDTKRKFSSWIYRIAHNEAVNYIKRKSYFKILSIEQNEFLKNTIAQMEHLMEEIIKKENAKNLHRILNKLSFRYKEVLVLRYFEEKTYEEISDILRVPVSTVGTIIKRAKEQLNKISREEKLEFG